jgi:SAM-dependent methyltransferase
MIDISQADKSRIASQNISYYDEIANSYDEILNRENSNKLVRQEVKEKFTSLLQPEQWVLDFGGGTGLDLEWLTANKYNILFCEPSVIMREKAVQYNNTKLHDDAILFLGGDKTDFSAWHLYLPFSQQVDGILCNFGVINCIPNIDFLFKNLALVIKPGGHFVALFLDRSLKKMWKWHRRNTVRSVVFGSPFIMYVHHKEHKQTVFVHSVKEIKKAAASSFVYASPKNLGESGFILIHLIRK